MGRVFSNVSLHNNHHQRRKKINLNNIIFLYIYIAINTKEVSSLVLFLGCIIINLKQMKKITLTMFEISNTLSFHFVYFMGNIHVYMVLLLFPVSEREGERREIDNNTQ